MSSQNANVVYATAAAAKENLRTEKQSVMAIQNKDGATIGYVVCNGSESALAVYARSLGYKSVSPGKEAPAPTPSAIAALLAGYTDEQYLAVTGHARIKPAAEPVTATVAKPADPVKPAPKKS